MTIAWTWTGENRHAKYEESPLLHDFPSGPIASIIKVDYGGGDGTEASTADNES